MMRKKRIKQEVDNIKIIMGGNMDTKTIKEKELSFFKPIAYGTFADIYTVDINGKTFCYKKFLDSIDNDFASRLEKSTQMDVCDNLVFPKLLVDDYGYKGYVTDYFPYYNINLLKYANIDDKITILKNVKNLIEKMHKDYKIIHGDLHSGNIMFDSKSKDCVIIDFDACSFNDISIDRNHTNEYVQSYMYYNGVDFSMDIFMFNLNTFAIMNNAGNISDAFNDIFLEKYGVFNNECGIDVCNKAYKLQRTENYLIDYINKKNI